MINFEKKTLDLMKRDFCSQVRDFNANNFFNPLTLMSDRYRVSPYNINTISSRQVMRIKKSIN